MLECTAHTERGRCRHKVYPDTVEGNPLCYYHKKVKDGLIKGEEDEA